MDIKWKVEECVGDEKIEKVVDVLSVIVEDEVEVFVEEVFVVEEEFKKGEFML